MHNEFDKEGTLFLPMWIIGVGCATPCSSPHFVLAHELVGQVLRSQQSEMGLLEQLVRKRRIGFIFSSIIMYKSLAIFMKGCTKVKSHKWICDVKLVRHVGRKKEKKEARGKGHSAKGEPKKRNWLKQSQDKLACI